MKQNEFAAVMSMAGKKQLYCLNQENETAVDEQALWTACCSMVADGIMTQADGAFRLRRDWHELLTPVVFARNVLTLHASDSRIRPVMYYQHKEAMTALSITAYGGFSLMPMYPDTLMQSLLEHLALEPYEPVVELTEPEEPEPVLPSWTLEQLLQKGIFVLEVADPDTGERRHWLRGVYDQCIPWLEWPHGEQINRTTLTAAHLDECLRSIVEGASKL